jgi:microcompartment protein CcmK/EutM
MILGKVVGTIVATTKDENLEGTKLLIVQHCDPSLKALPLFTIAADGVGAGETEIVLVVTGSSARMATTLKNRPLDASIIAIVDVVDVDGKTTYRKSG